MSYTTFYFFFFFNDTATTEIYTLSLHDALPICIGQRIGSEHGGHEQIAHQPGDTGGQRQQDRKSTRLNSSHLVISYAVFCLKKKKRKTEYLVHSWHFIKEKHVQEWQIHLSNVAH